MNVCIGHILKTCPKCIPDEFNKHCDRFVSVQITFVEVDEKPSRVLSEKEKASGRSDNPP